MVPKRLGDVCRLETRAVRFQTGVNAALEKCLKSHLFEERMNQLNVRISQLEKKHDVDTRTLNVRCDNLKNELATLKERVNTEETKMKVSVQRPLSTNDSALSKVFSGRDLEVMTIGLNSLKEWTDKVHFNIINDSKKDPFSADALFKKVKSKENIAVIGLVGFTKDRDVFGGFYSVAVTKQNMNFWDPDMFVFSLESHGRCMTPQKYLVKEGLKDNAHVSFLKNNDDGFFEFWVEGAGGFLLGNEESKSFCWDMSKGFEGLDDRTLTGQNGTWKDGPYHHCTRLVAVELS